MVNRRVERLSDLLKREISSILFHKMKDPRLSLCSVTDVVLSKDYRHAKVYVSFLGTPQQREESIKALNSASGFIRHELGRVQLKHVPELVFYHDSGAEYSQHIEELLKSVKREDSEE
jgi:ribosome-binding factor A